MNCLHQIISITSITSAVDVSFLHCCSCSNTDEAISINLQDLASNFAGSSVLVHIVFQNCTDCFSAHFNSALTDLIISIITFFVFCGTISFSRRLSTDTGFETRLATFPAGYIESKFPLLQVVRSTVSAVLGIYTFEIPT